MVDEVQLIYNILPYVNDSYLKTALPRVIEFYEFKRNCDKVNFYGDIIPIPKDINNDLSKKLTYIRNLLIEHPELFKHKRTCVCCGNDLHPSKFGVSKVKNDVYLRSYCYDCVKKSSHKQDKQD